MLLYIAVYMSLLVSLWIIAAAVAWFEKSVVALFACLTGVITFLSVSHVTAIWKDQILDKSMRAMDRTECCCSKACSDPFSIRLYTCALRAISSILAIASIAMSWYYVNSISTYYKQVQLMWVVTSILWLVSCIPFFIGLIQCAAHISNITRTPQHYDKIHTIMEFRKYAFMWLMHDVVLGLFWLFLAADLPSWILRDDPEWRVVFCSMLSWHLVILVLHFLTSTTSLDVQEGAFSKKNTSFWLKILRLVGLFGAYLVVMQRIHAGQLATLGCSLSELVLFAIFVLCFTMGKPRQQVPSRRKKTFDPPDMTQTSGLFF